MLLLSVACTSKVSDNGGHAHDDITVPYTAYSGKVEVFADVQPLAVGGTSELIVHLTSLENFKPIVTPYLNLSLEVGQKGIRVKSENALKPGIFKLAIQPEYTGKGRLVFEFLLDGKNHQVSIDDVMVYDDPHEAVHWAEKDIPSSPNGISFTKEQSWKVDFKAEEIALQSFGDVFKASARVTISPLAKSVVAAKSNGFVQFTAGLLTAGKDIRKGESLLTISGKGLTENNAIVRLQEAKVEYEIAKTDYERDQRLHQQKIVSDRKLLEAKARLDKARNQWRSLQSTVNVNGERIRSSATGFIDEVYVNNGDYVTAGSPLLSIGQNSRMLITALVPSSQMLSIEHLSDASIEFNNHEIMNLSDLDGYLVSVGQSVDKSSQQIPVMMEIDHHPLLLDGGVVNVYLKTSDNKQRLLVPKSALVEMQGLYFVYIQLTPELFERRQVEIGNNDGHMFVIEKGLMAGERIVTQGAILVKLAAMSNTVDPHAGHVH